MLHSLSAGAPENGPNSESVYARAAAAAEPLRCGSMVITFALQEYACAQYNVM